MYSFTNTTIAGLTVSNTIARQGTEHHKLYTESGVTPLTQNTLNVYVSGTFNVSAGSFSQQLEAGNCSLDLTISEYLKDIPVIEKVLSGWGARFCVSCSKSWSWQVHTLTALEAANIERDSLGIALQGDLLVGESMMKSISYRFIPKSTTAVAQTSSKLIVCYLN